MNIDKNSITLTEDTYAYIYRASEQEIFETFRDTLKKYINIIDDLVNKDFKKLSDEEFYDILCKVYSISLTEEDYLKIISKRNNKKYNRFTEIGTFMTFTDTYLYFLLNGGCLEFRKSSRHLPFYAVIMKI